MAQDVLLLLENQAIQGYLQLHLILVIQEVQVCLLVQVALEDPKYQQDPSCKINQSLIFEVNEIYLGKLKILTYWWSNRSFATNLARWTWRSIRPFISLCCR